MTEIEQFLDTLRRLVASNDAIKTNHVSIGLLRPAAEQLLSELERSEAVLAGYGK